jgi:hypothetical protein
MTLRTVTCIRNGRQPECDRAPVRRARSRATDSSHDPQPARFAAPPMLATPGGNHRTLVVRRNSHPGESVTPWPLRAPTREGNRGFRGSEAPPQPLAGHRRSAALSRAITSAGNATPRRTKRTMATIAGAVALARSKVVSAASRRTGPLGPRSCLREQMLGDAYRG